MSSGCAWTPSMRPTIPISGPAIRTSTPRCSEWWPRISIRASCSLGCGINSNVTPLWEQVTKARVFDLAQPYFAGMPHFPTHPPFLFGLTKKHGDMVGPAGHSSAADAIAMGSHVGTHIDALCHFSCGGRLHGGVEIEQSYGGGLGKYSIDTIAPILRRAVLLDLAKEGPLAADHEVTPE